MESNTISLSLSDSDLIEALADCATGHVKAITITLEVTEKDESLVNSEKDTDSPCCGMGDVDTEKPTKKRLTLRGAIKSIDYVEDEGESEDDSDDVEEPDEPAVGKYSGKMAKAIGKKGY